MDHPRTSAPLHARHIKRSGKEVHRLICDQDLEGIVAKLKYGAYSGMVQDPNPKYSQYEGRRELFEKTHAGVP